MVTVVLKLMLCHYSIAILSRISKEIARNYKSKRKKKSWWCNLFCERRLEDNWAVFALWICSLYSVFPKMLLKCQLLTCNFQLVFPSNFAAWKKRNVVKCSK